MPNLPNLDEIFDWDNYVGPSPRLGNDPALGGVSGGSGGTATKPPRDPFNPIDHAANSFEPRPDYDSDPKAWGNDVLGEFYWSKQIEILLSLVNHRYTAVQSCHDAGKSFIAARAIVRWIEQHEPGEAFVVSTAPTSAQVSAILWREIQRAHKKGKDIPGTITTAGYPQWKLGGELVGYGRKPADYSDSAFQGIHARYVLVVIDEACGVAEQLFNAADALATNAHARVLAIGNPDDPTSHFAKICKPNSGWNVIGIDGLRTPNFTRDAVEWLDCPQCRGMGRTEPLLAQLFREEDIPFTEEYVPESLRDMLLSPLWVEERLHRWVGIPDEAQTLSEVSHRSALFTAKVRGLFPTSASEGIVPLAWVQGAMQRHDEWVAAGRPALPVNERHVLGADIADQGEDQTCIAFREGHIVHEIRKYRNSDIMETTGYIKAAMTDRAGGLAVIDSIGVGSGVLSRLREQGVAVKGFVASGSAKGLKDKTREFGFINLRAAAWWKMRELLDPTQPGGCDIMLPNSEQLLADLTTPHWKVLSSGNIQVESKDDIRKRLGRSTDEGDAVVMSFWRGQGTVDKDLGSALSWYDESDGSAQSWNVDEMAEQWLMS